MWTVLAFIYMIVVGALWFYPDHAEPGERPIPVWNPVVDRISGALALFGFSAYVLSWTPDLLRASWRVAFFVMLAGHLAATGNDMWRQSHGTEVGREPVGVDEQGTLVDRPIVKRWPAWLWVVATLGAIALEAPLFVVNWRLASGS